MTTFFTSDTHYSHANIIKYCNRPFANTTEMDEKMISEWNTKVKLGDTVYHLGDFGFASDEYLNTVIRRLGGQKHLILGNHDKGLRKSKMLQGHFLTVSEFKEIRVNDTKIVLCHYPMAAWNRSHHGAWNLHGHCHGTFPVDMTQKRIDVGVDCFGFAPVSYEELQPIMAQRQFKPIDHHDQEDHD